MAMNKNEKLHAEQLTEGTSGPESPHSLRVYRHELKYFVSTSDYIILSSRLRSLLRPDPHAGPGNEYWIRSLYFDTLDNRDYFEKTAGVKNRQKIRLRIYELGQKKVKLEIKNKFADYMLKESALITRNQADSIISGDIEFMLSSSNSTLRRAYYLLRVSGCKPTALIDYEREPYISDMQNIRLTFDKNIRASISEFNLFRDRIVMTRVFEDNPMVLEIKYDRFLPDWLRQSLSDLHPVRYAISKYCLGRAIL